jgi:hypothetical protein
MASFAPFPHIGHLRHLEAHLHKDGGAGGLPARLRYRGTVKLHGTNAAVVQAAAGGDLLAQSRNRIIDVSADNCGFALFVEERTAAFERLFASLRAKLPSLPPDAPLHIFGEFGGKGVQRGVAVAQVPKFFAIIAVLAAGRFVDMEGFSELHDVEGRIFHVLQFGKWNVELDAAEVAASSAEITRLTEAVGKRCPAGRFLGVDGPGEGLVWQCLEMPEDPSLWFKSKCEEMRVSPEALPSGGSDASERARFFAEAVMTAPRVEQAQTAARELGKSGKSAVGAIIAWAVEDALREEGGFLQRGSEEHRAHLGALRSRARALALERFEED